MAETEALISLIGQDRGLTKLLGAAGKSANTFSDNLSDASGNLTDWNDGLGKSEKALENATRATLKAGKGIAEWGDNAGKGYDGFIDGAKQTVDVADLLGKKFVGFGARMVGLGKPLDAVNNYLQPMAGLFSDVADQESAAGKSAVILDAAEKPVVATLKAAAKIAEGFAKQLESMGVLGEMAAEKMHALAGGLRGISRAVGIADTAGDIFLVAQRATEFAQDAGPAAAKTAQLIAKTFADSSLGAKYFGDATKTATTISKTYLSVQNLFPAAQNATAKALAETTLKFVEFSEKAKVFLLVANMVQNAYLATKNLNETFSAFEAMGVDTTYGKLALSMGIVGEKLLFDKEAAEKFTTAAIAGYAKLEDQLAYVRTLSAASGKSFEELGGAMQGLVNGPLKNAITSTEASSALYNTMSAGVTDVAQSTDFMAAGLKLAAGSGADASTTMEALIKTMSAYGISSRDASTTASKLNGIVESGIVSFPQLAGGFARVAGVAKSSGVGLDELGASIASLTYTMSADDAMTGFSSLLSSIAGQGAQSEAAIAALGIKFDINTVKTKGLAASLKELYNATGGSTEKLKEIIPDSLAFSTALTLMTSGAGKTAQFTKDIAGTTSESLDKMFDRRRESTMQRATALMNGFQEVIISFGARLMPIIEPGISFLEGLLKNLNALPEPVKAMIGALIVAQVAMGKAVDIGASFGGMLGNIAQTLLIGRAASLLFSGQLLKEVSILKDSYLAQGRYGDALLRVFGVEDMVAKAKLKNEAKAAASQGIPSGVPSGAAETVRDLANAKAEEAAAAVGNVAAAEANLQVKKQEAVAATNAAAASHANAVAKQEEVVALIESETATTAEIEAKRVDAAASINAAESSRLNAAAKLEEVAAAEAVVVAEEEIAASKMHEAATSSAVLAESVAEADAKLALADAAHIEAAATREVTASKLQAAAAAVALSEAAALEVAQKQQVLQATLANSAADAENIALKQAEVAAAVEAAAAAELNATAKTHEAQVAIAASVATGEHALAMEADALAAAQATIATEVNTDVKAKNTLLTNIGAAATKAWAFVSGAAAVGTNIFTAAITVASGALKAFWVSFGPLVLVAAAAAAAFLVLQDFMPALGGAAGEANKTTEALDKVSDSMNKTGDAAKKAKDDTREYTGAINNLAIPLLELLPSMGAFVLDLIPGLDAGKKVHAFFTGMKDEMQAYIDAPVWEAIGRANKVLDQSTESTMRQRAKMQKGNLFTNQAKDLLAAAHATQGGIAALKGDDLEKALAADRDAMTKTKDANDKLVSGYKEQLATLKNPEQKAALQNRIDQLNAQTSALEKAQKAQETYLRGMNTIAGAVDANNAATSVGKTTEYITKSMTDTLDKLPEFAKESARETFMQIENVTNKNSPTQRRATTKLAGAAKLMFSEFKNLGNINSPAQLDQMRKNVDSYLDNVDEAVAKGSISQDVANTLRDQVKNQTIKVDTPEFQFEGSLLGSEQLDRISKSRIDGVQAIADQELQVQQTTQSEIAADLSEHLISEQEAQKQNAELEIDQTQTTLDAEKNKLTEMTEGSQEYIAQEQKVAQLENQLRDKKAQADEQEFQREQQRQQRQAEIDANTITLPLKEQLAGLDVVSKQLELQNTLMQSRSSLTQTIGQYEEARISNQLKVTQDIEQQAKLQADLAVTRQNNLLKNQKVEQMSLEVSLRQNQIATEREVINNRIAQAENERAIASAKLEKLAAERKKATQEELDLIDQQITGLEQQGEALGQQGALSEKAKQQQVEIAQNSRKELEYKQAIAREGGALDVQLAKQRQIVAVYEKQQQVAKLAAQAADLAGQIQLARADATAKIYERQTQLLSAQKGMLDAHTGQMEAYFQMGIDAEKSDFRKAQLTREMNQIKLATLARQQEMELKVFDIQQMQNKLALMREQIQNRIGKSSVKAEIAGAYAEKKKVESTPGATKEQIEAANLTYQATLEKGAGLEFQGQMLDTQGQAQDQISGIQRDAMVINQQTAYDQARYAGANEQEKQVIGRGLMQIGRNTAYGMGINPRAISFVNPNKPYVGATDKLERPDALPDFDQVRQDYLKQNGQGANLSTQQAQVGLERSYQQPSASSLGVQQSATKQSPTGTATGEKTLQQTSMAMSEGLNNLVAELRAGKLSGDRLTITLQADGKDAKKLQSSDNELISGLKQVLTETKRRLNL